MNRLIEFFEDDTGQLSMTRLTMILSFIPATWIALNNVENGIFGIYMSSYAGAYVGGRLASAVQNRGSSKFREGDLKWQRS